MAVSQLRIFSASDVGAPQLTGQTGSLVALLDAVLVNGYGATSSLGWTKPLANDSLTSSLGCWKQPSGSGLILYMNDAAPTGSTNGGGKEAWVCGYESILGLTGSIFPTTGTGGGQFPSGSQVFTVVSNGGTANSASLWWRKSTSADNATRYWILFGDTSTFYLFVQANDTYGVYYVMWFGDIYSLKTNDSYKCMIHGRCADQANTSTYRFDASDLLMLVTDTSYPMFFMARSISGQPGSQFVNKIGDRGKTVYLSLSTPTGDSATVSEMAGICPASDAGNSVTISPIWVTEPGSAAIRGRMRGLYHVVHPVASFTDGQVFVGGNEYIGRTFQVVKTGPFINGTNVTLWVVETSNTVETN